MAKALLLRALRQSFGHMVDGLESENLQVAVWSGEIHLENLSLRRDAFDGIDLPIEIKVGKVKSLKISVPWTRLGSEPVRVLIDGIYAHAVLRPEAGGANAASTPGNPARADDFLQRRRLREKRRTLRWAALTEGEIDDNVDTTHDSGQRQEEDAGFWSQLLSKVVDNLVVEIRHCHIRIEDSAKWTNRKFAFGFSMRTFSALTCDASGNVQFVDRAGEGNLLHRMIKCEDVALYWDPINTENIVGDERWLEYLHSSEFSTRRAAHKYILRPCSPHVLMTKNDAPSAESPRWNFNVDLSGVHVSLSRVQFEDVTAVYLAAEAHIVRMSPNPRPVASPLRNPRAWWKYAIRRVIQDYDLETKVETRSWASLCKRVVKRQRYIGLYKRTKKASWLEPLSEREKEILKELEDELHINDVLAFRATALAELRAQKAKSNPSVQSTNAASQAQQQESKSRGFFRSFFGGNASQISNELTPEEKAEIEAAIDYLEASRRTRVPETTRNMVVKSSLKNASLTLLNAAEEEIMLVSVEGHLLVETCVGPYWKTSFHLMSFEVVDKFTKDTIFPVLIAPQKSALSREGAVMTVAVEVKPVNKPEDVAISISLIPFKIILVPNFMAQISKFFVVSEETRLGEMASEALTEWTESKQDDLVEALARRTLISLIVDIEDPIVACPLTVSKSAVDLHMIVLDLGQLRIESDDSRLRLRRDDSTAGGEGIARESLAIDAWRMKSKNVRAFLLPASALLTTSDDWGFLDANEDRVLFHDFDLDARLAVCIIPKLLQVTKTRVLISASALRLRAPPSLFRFAAKLGTSWSRILAGTSGQQQPLNPVSVAEEEIPPVAIAPVLGTPPLLEVDVSVDALITTLSLEAENVPLARLELVGFTMKHSRMANGDVDTQMGLNSVEVFDLYSSNPPVLATSRMDRYSKEDLSLKNDTEVPSTAAERLISVRVEYRRQGTTVDAKFNQLHVNWKPETIMAYKNSYHAPNLAEEDGGVDDELPQSPAPMPLSISPSPVAASSSKKFWKISASMNAFNLAMCKGDYGRVLALCVVSNARLLFVQEEATTFKFWLGNFKSLQPKATRTALDEYEAFEFFTAVPGKHESLFAFEYIDGGDFPQKQSEDEIYCGINISPARLVYQQQMILELLDYLSEGVMGAIVTKATDSLTIRSVKKYRVQLDWFQPILVMPAQSTLATHPDAFFEFQCAEVRASNMYDKPEGADTWFTKTHIEARELDISGYLPSPFEAGRTSRTSLVKHSVSLDLDIISPLTLESTRTVTGRVSEIEVCLPRVFYFLYHKMMRENLLADPPKSSSTETASQPTLTPPLHEQAISADEASESSSVVSKPHPLAIQKVSYAYDRNDGPPSTFDVSISFPKASLQIVEEEGQEIATFAMRRATLRLVREQPYDPTTTLLQVEVLDLVDDRPDSRQRCFRHLILCDPSKSGVESKQHSFEVKYIGAHALVEIDLHMFRSVVLLDLFWSVLKFITTSEPEEGTHYARYPYNHEKHAISEMLESHPLENRARSASIAASGSAVQTVTPWRGQFRLRRASMFFVVDWANPKTDAIVLGGDLDIEWRKREDGCASVWTGKINRFELYRAQFPNAVPDATSEQSDLALHTESVGHQITEPADVSFEYAYEMDSMHSKIHSRRIHFSMSQMENFLSISDMQTMRGVYENIMRGDAPPSMSSSLVLDGKDKIHPVKRATPPPLRVPVWEYFQLGSSALCWAGSRMEKPPSEIRPRLSDLPIKTAAKISRKRLETKAFTVEFTRFDHGVEFLENDGFVVVGSVDRESVAYGLIVPGDVLVAVNYTPVLTKTPSAVVALIEEEKSGPVAQPLSFSIHPSECRDPLILKDSSHLESAAVVLHLIDDTGQRDLPLAHLSFSKINAFRNDNNAGNSVVCGANLLLAMHYHDAISGRWEMLMSPWTANLGVHFLSHGQIDAKFDTSNDLEFRLSDVFVRASSDAFRRVSTKVNKDEGQGACHLRNRTGMPLWFWLVQSDHEQDVNDETTTKIRVNANETIAFSFAHQKGSGAGTRRNYHHKRANRVRVILGDENQWQPLPEIPAEIVHRGSVMLAPMDVSESLPAWRQVKVAWEVMLEDGRLCLELRSFRRVENLLKCPIQVLPSTSVGGPCPDRVIVEPNSIAALPIAYGEISDIRIRPLLNPNADSSAQYQWSEPSYVELASQRGTSLVTSAPPVSNPEKLRPFLAHIHVQVEEEDGATVRFTVHPPIIVRNQLPVPLYCRLFTGRNQVGNDLELVPGGYAQINQLSVEGFNSFLAFRFKNSRQFTADVRVERKRKVSSTPLEFRGDGADTVASHKRTEETTQLTIVDGDGLVIPLSVVQETTEYEGLRFVVYCPVWLVNRTELPLSYGYGTGKWSTTGAGTSCPAGIMLYSAAEESGGKLQVRVAESTPSAPFSVSAPDGKARRLVVPGSPSWPFSFDLAVSVDVGGGDLYRTNVVTFAPRYQFLNRLEVNIVVRQIWDDMSGIVGTPPPAELTIRPHCKEPFWASSSTRVRPFRLEIRAVSPRNEFDTVWSTPFTLEKYLEGRAVVPVELQVKNSREPFKFNMEVREDQIAGSLDVDIYEWQAPESPMTLEEANEAAAEEDYITVDLKRKILPKTVAKLRFPRLDVVLRRDAAAKQTKSVPPPPPPPPGSAGPRRSISPTQTGGQQKRSIFPSTMNAQAATQSMTGVMQKALSRKTPPPPPPPPLPPPDTAATPPPPPPPPALSTQSSYDESSVTNQPMVPAGTQRWSERRKVQGESTEIARLTIKTLDLTIGKRSDGFRELQLFIRELRVRDPYPGATFREAIEGLPHTDGWLLKVHIIQRGLIFEKFLVRLPGLKLKVDERFVLGLARYANDAVLKPIASGNQMSVDMDGLDNSQLIADMIERRDSASLVSGTTSQNALIFFNSFYISGFEIRLWYHQVKRDASTPSVVSFGLFSKLDIRIENHPLKFAPLSLKKPLGSYNLYTGMVRDHYEREARSQISGILMRSIDLTSASFAVADSFLSRIVGTEVRSKEFRGESLSNEEIVERYRRKIQKPTSLDSFVRDVVRNCAFDWSYNHTGIINSRRALVVGVVNRSDHDVEIRSTLERGQNYHIMPGGLATRQLGKDGIRITAPAGRAWDTSSTCLILAYGFLDTVDLKLESNAFVARFVYVDTILQSRPGFSAAFLAKDVSKWLCWYVLMIENRVVT